MKTYQFDIIVKQARQCINQSISKKHQDMRRSIRGGIKKNFFFQENPRRGGGGVSPNPKFPYQKILRFFWIFFFKRGGGSHLFQKGVIIKEWGFWNIFVKRGGFHPIHRDFIKKKLRIFRNFLPKGGGSRQFRNFLIRKNWGFRIAERGEGRSQNSEFF